MGQLCSQICNSEDNGAVDKYMDGLPHLQESRSGSLMSVKVSRGELPTLSFENIHNIYVMETEPTGHGGFGKIIKARLRADPSVIVAVKIIRKSSSQMNSLAMKEIELLKNMDHPFIVKFKEVYQDQYYYYIVLEYLNGGDLQKLLGEEQYLSEEATKSLLWQMVLATNYLHIRKIVHGDIKPENFVLVKAGSSRLKMIDFGLADVLKKTDNSGNISGSRYFLAPEVLKGSYNEKRDIWSIGCLLYLFITGVLPFYSEFEEDLFDTIRRGHFDLEKVKEKKCSEELVDLLLKLLQQYPEDRISAQEAIMHPWFDELRNKMVEDGQSIASLKMLDNLKRFTVSSTFKREMIALITQSFENEEQIESVIKVFFSIDSDFSGSVSMEELELLFKLAGKQLEDYEAKSIISSLHIREKGALSFLEFTIGTMDYEFFSNPDRLYLLFKLLDIDQNGKLGFTDLNNAFARFGRGLTGNKINSMISEVDINNDREISWEEFRTVMEG